MMGCYDYYWFSFFFFFFLLTMEIVCQQVLCKTGIGVTVSIKLCYGNIPFWSEWFRANRSA